MTDVPREYNAAVDLVGRNLAAGRGGKIAYIDDAGSCTYAQLAERVDRAANALHSLNIHSEERIAIAMLDSADWVALFLGAIKAGVVAVPVNTLMTEDDYRFMLADSRARLLVVSQALYPKFANLITSAADLEHVIVDQTDVVAWHRPAAAAVFHVAGTVGEEDVQHLGRAEPVEDVDAIAFRPAPPHVRRQRLAGRDAASQRELRAHRHRGAR